MLSKKRTKKTKQTNKLSARDMPWMHIYIDNDAFGADTYEELMDLVEDLELGRLADVRLADGQEPVRVSLDAF